MSLCSFVAGVGPNLPFYAHFPNFQSKSSNEQIQSCVVCVVSWPPPTRLVRKTFKKKSCVRNNCPQNNGINSKRKPKPDPIVMARPSENCDNHVVDRFCFLNPTKPPTKYKPPPSTTKKKLRPNTNLCPICPCSCPTFRSKTNQNPRNQNRKRGVCSVSFARPQFKSIINVEDCQGPER